ncbi:GNAT family protein [Algoriphagus algorifonticola]|uniref:hypothetical protein n=1 Tax=Algoriphagus algorifonticola TaxID=2593007 RepID=UPI0011A14FF3|nr:hypothetical protein [Algoriphagus algorifonticola]
MDQDRTKHVTFQREAVKIESKDYFLAGEVLADFLEAFDFTIYKKDKLKGWISFRITSDYHAISLPKAPMGGIWLERGLDSQVIEDFIAYVLEELKSFDVKQVKIIQAPKPYSEDADLINYLLYHSGFVQEKLQAHHFFCGTKRMKKFIQSESASFSKKLKNQKLELCISSIQNFNFLQEIVSWNKRRGYQVNLEESRLIQQVSSFPERYFLISLKNEGIAQAHSLAVKLSSNSMYYYLSAVDPNTKFKHLGDLLLWGLFQLAVDEKVEFIDLGSSETDSGANHSLMFFKAKFSNDVFNKIIWIKDI